MTRSVALFLVVAFAGITGALATIDACGGTWSSFDGVDAPDVSSVLDGRWARAVDAHFQAESAVMRRTRPAWNAGGWLVFRETPPYVVAGADDWLFYSPSLGGFEPAEGRALMEARLTEVGGYGAMAKAANVPFVCLVMPSKFRLYGDRLARGAVPPERRSVLAEARRRLTEAGIDAPDVLSWLRDVDGAFPPNDTHLSRPGFAALAARVVTRLGVDHGTALARLAALPTRTALHAGDLVELMSLDADGLVGSRLARSETEILAPPTLNTSAADVLCLGDSFFEHYGFLLPRLIGAASGMSVDARAVGPFFFEQIERVMAEHRARPPKAVLFILSERQFAPE